MKGGGKEEREGEGEEEGGTSENNPHQLCIELRNCQVPLTALVSMRDIS